MYLLRGLLHPWRHKRFLPDMSIGSHRIITRWRIAVKAIITRVILERSHYPNTEDASYAALDYDLLEDDTERYAIEIEVYPNGETEVSSSIYLELSAIDEMWPAAAGAGAGASLR